MEVSVMNILEAAKMLRLDSKEMCGRLQSGGIPAYRDGCNWKIPKMLLVKYVEDEAMEEAKQRKGDDIPIAPSLYSLSNKMGNSLLDVRDINHKYIVVEKKF